MSARRRTVVALAGLAAGSAFAIGVRSSAARSDVTLPYAFADVWPSAVRFLRIDRGYALKEKDEASGYLLFELEEGKRTYRGALELVKRRDEDGREVTRVLASLPDLPRHWEQTLLDKLALKVREDHGAPPAAPRKPGPAPKPNRDAAPPAK